MTTAVVGAGLRGLTREERMRALEAIEWAASRDAAGVDMELADEVRLLVRRGGLDAAGWDRAWALAARLVVLASEQAGRLRVDVAREPLVLEAARLLGAVRAGGYSPR